MLRLVGKFETLINYVLLIMMAIVLILTTIDLGWTLIKDIFAPPAMLLEVTELLNLFAAFLLVLIGVELFETVKVYATDKSIQVELILSVGLVAIARKVIILDPKQLDGLSLIGIAAIILSLAAAYYVVKAARPGTGPR
jgi:uncharacterized membrane protein (DUF373 family)